MLQLLSPLPINAACPPASMRAQSAGRRYRLTFSAAKRRSLIKKNFVLPPSVWCELYIHLPEDASIPGPSLNVNMPNLAGMLDVSFDPQVREVVCCWEPQMAKTSMGLNTIGYRMDRFPGNLRI